MLFVVLAPNRPIKGTRMFIPESLIPKVEGMAPGAEPPLSAKIKRIMIAGLFFGPFGAMAGLGIGLLLEGARQSFSRRKDRPDDPSVK